MSWALDDFPAFEYVPRTSTGLSSNEVVYQRWKDHFDFAYGRVPGGVFVLTVHPQTIARAHAFMMFERFLDYVAGHDEAWITTLSDIASIYKDD